MFCITRMHLGGPDCCHADIYTRISWHLVIESSYRCINADYNLWRVQSETVRKLKKAFVPKMMTADQASTF